MGFSLFLYAKLLVSIPSYVYFSDGYNQGVGEGALQKNNPPPALPYEINPSLELSLLPYVEMYRGSTYFFFASQLTTPSSRLILVGLATLTGSSRLILVVLGNLTVPPG